MTEGIKNLHICGTQVFRKLEAMLFIRKMPGTEAPRGQSSSDEGAKKPPHSNIPIARDEQICTVDTRSEYEENQPILLSPAST